MRTNAIAAKITASLVLATVASAASATTGPFYSCIRKPVTVFDGTVVDAAVATPALSTLVSAVTAAGLADDLAAAQDITVYAPTDDAFAKIPADILSAITGDAAVLTTVLTYHVTPGLNDPRRWSQPVSRDTLAGQTVTYSFNDGQAKVNNANVSCRGVKTDNGIVWIIDSVLLPQF